MSSQVYEVVKTIYATTSDAESNPISVESADSTPRIKVLQSTLGQLRLNNIATLDALMTHFTRLIDLTSADDAYVNTLSQTLAPCVLRPKSENSLTLNERHAHRLVRDLFDHKESIFGELKRQSATLGHLGGPAASFGGSQRVRIVSNSDESNRRANMEARMAAISERTRDKSPAPTNRHRRDKSADGSVSMRFPVAVSTPVASRSSMGSGANRQSLEVPGSTENSPASHPTQPPALKPVVKEAPHTNGHSSSPSNGMPGAFMGTFSGGGPGPHIPPVDDNAPTSEPSTATSTTDVGKQASLKRSALGGSGKARRGYNPNSGSLSHQASLDGVREGVTLSDKPMDD